MVVFQTCKIYKLECNTTGKVYFGSTKLSLKTILQEHKKNRHKKNRTSSQVVENNDFSIQLLEEVEYSDKKVLAKRKRYYIENNDCVNKVIPGRTEKEYKNDNRDKISKQQKEYRIQHRDDIIQKQLQKTQCECGSIISKSNTSRHLKTKKHQYYLIHLEEKRIKNNLSLYYNKMTTSTKTRYEYEQEYYQKNADKISDKKRLYYWGNKFNFVNTVDCANKIAKQKKLFMPFIKQLKKHTISIEDIADLRDLFKCLIDEYTEIPETS